MRHPMSFWEIITAKSGRFHNMLYYIIGVVPPCISAILLRFMVRRYGIKQVK